MTVPELARQSEANQQKNFGIKRYNPDKGTNTVADVLIGAIGGLAT